MKLIQIFCIVDVVCKAGKTIHFLPFLVPNLLSSSNVPFVEKLMSKGFGFLEGGRIDFTLRCKHQAIFVSRSITVHWTYLIASHCMSHCIWKHQEIFVSRSITVHWTYLIASHCMSHCIWKHQAIFVSRSSQCTGPISLHLTVCLTVSKCALKEKLRFYFIFSSQSGYS